MSRLRGCLLLVMITAGCSSPDDAQPAPTPLLDAGTSDARHGSVLFTMGDLAVDNDRNGVVEPESTSEQQLEDEWNEVHGAVFLANVDDDDEDGLGDHEDDVLNGPLDLADLAPIRLSGFADVPAGATGTISVDAASVDRVRLFKRSGDSYELVDAARVDISANELTTGVDFAIEARTFAASLEEGAWTGETDVELRVTAAGTELTRDRVRLRVAPLIFMHNAMDTERIWVSGFDAPFVQGVKSAAASADIPVEVLRYNAPGYADHEFDPWTQDHFEIGYASMPGPDGPHVMLVAFRTPRVVRTSADVVFVELRGPDVGAVHVHATPYDDETRSLDSTGNWDTVPPHTAHGTSYPLGRVIVGSVPERHPDVVAEAFMEAQRVQPILRVDTSWLSVGHIDELLMFVKASTPRGWRMLFARPALAVALLEQVQSEGNGQATLHDGKWWWWGPASRTVDQVLADPDLMATNQEDQAILDGIAEQLRDELELTDDDITYMPFLEYAFANGSVAYQPATVNLLAFGDQLLLPQVFGPLVNGEDVFVRDLNERLGAVGLHTHYVDDWDTYHRNNGEVHCATNVLRVPDDTFWWETGR